MSALNYVGPLLAFAGVAVIVLVAVAIVQDMKQERKYGYRQAFYTIVSLVMILLTAGAVVSLLTTGLREGVFTKAREFSQRYNSPPGLYLPSQSTGKAVLSAYSCADSCQLTADDKTAISEWKMSYTNWLGNNNQNQQMRRDVAGALAILIVCLPLYIVFSRWMNRGAKEEQAIHKKTSPLRSVYFFGMAFAGLVAAAVGLALLLNTGLNKAFKVNSNSSTSITASASDFAGVNSIVSCAGKCDISQDDATLAKEWKSDWQAYTDRQNSNEGSTENDLVATIPLILVGLPLFWYHFARIRKETQVDAETPKTS